MAKAKVQTVKASNFGHTIDFGGLELTFDKLGFAEVESQEVAEALALNYGGWLYAGEKPKEKNRPAMSDEALDLQKDIIKLEEKIVDKDATIAAVTKEAADWKALIDQYKETAENAVAELEGFKTQTDKQIKELELKAQLNSKNVKELTDFCITLEIPEERYKGKKKDELVTIILDESRNK
jgi:hypothetical protein